MNQQNIQPESGATPGPPTPADVGAFRVSAMANGYELVAVKTRSKIPAGTGWQHGHIRERLVPASAAELNTGVLARGLRVLDIDVDEGGVAGAVKALAEQVLGCTLVRSRRGSGRMALLYRAAEGAPPKRTVAGAAGKIEFLGDGQQLVADGIHPDGEPYAWEAGRGPHNTPSARLTAITEDQVTRFLAEVRSVIGAPAASTAPAVGGNVTALFGVRPTAFDAMTNLPDMTAAMQAGMDRLHWFARLSPAEQNELVRRMLSALASKAHAGRAEWLAVLFGAAHAETLGATEARNAALEWSRPGATFDPAGFDRDWTSFRSGKVGVGTMLRLAGEAGLDLAPWHALANAGQASAAALTVAGPSALFSPVRFAAADLRPVPWAVRGLAVVGGLTVIAAPGGGAKTVAMLDLCVCVAAGRPSWGPFSIPPRADGQPHRVAFVSGEEDEGRIGLMVAAACNANGLGGTEPAAVEAGLSLHDATNSGFAIGEPKPGERDIPPEEHDRWCTALRAELLAKGVTLLVMDTLAALVSLPSENDNSAVTTLLRRLARVARDVSCAVILLHHLPKMSREAAAAVRGDPVAVRGGGAIVNTSRVAWTISSLPATEAAQFLMAGAAPAAVRRLDPVKLNDAPQPPPAFFEVVGVPVTLADGSTESVRAIRFIRRPPSGAAGIQPSRLNAAMNAIDKGVIVGGARQPLGSGRGAREAKAAVARALTAADDSLSEVHARTMAGDLLRELERHGCIESVEVVIPKFKADGVTRSGGNKRQGYEARWARAWWVAPAGAPAPDGAP